MSRKWTIFKYGLIIGLAILSFPLASMSAITDQAFIFNSPSKTISQAQSIMIQDYITQKKYQDSIHFIDTELKSSPNNIDLLNKKAGIYIEMGQYDKALTTVSQVSALQPKNAEAEKLRKLIEEAMLSIPRNEIGFNTDEAYVSDVQGYWNFSSLHYYHFGDSGTYGARVNYAKRYGTTGEQYQLEAYPKFPEHQP